MTSITQLPWSIPIDCASLVVRDEAGISKRPGRLGALHKARYHGALAAARSLTKLVATLDDHHHKGHGSVNAANDGAEEKTLSSPTPHSSSADNTDRAATDALIASELAALARLQHPNLVTFMGLVLDEASRPHSLLFSFMLRGSVYDAIVKSSPPSHALVFSLRVACDALRGLSFLHAHSIPHGALSTSNILRGRDNRFRLGDYGLARLRSHVMPSTEAGRDGLSLSDQCYMRSGSYRANVVNDVFALATCIVQMVKWTSLSNIEAVRKGIPEVAAVSRGLADLVTSMLEEDDQGADATTDPTVTSLLRSVSDLLKDAGGNSPSSIELASSDLPSPESSGSSLEEDRAQHELERVQATKRGTGNSHASLATAINGQENHTAGLASTSASALAPSTSSHRLYQQAQDRSDDNLLSGLVDVAEQARMSLHSSTADSKGHDVDADSSASHPSAVGQGAGEAALNDMNSPAETNGSESSGGTYNNGNSTNGNGSSSGTSADMTALSKKLGSDGPTVKRRKRTSTGKDKHASKATDGFSSAGTSGGNGSSANGGAVDSSSSLDTSARSGGKPSQTGSANMQLCPMMMPSSQLSSLFQDSLELWRMGQVHQAAQSFISFLRLTEDPIAMLAYRRLILEVPSAPKFTGSEGQVYLPEWLLRRSKALSANFETENFIISTLNQNPSSFARAVIAYCLASSASHRAEGIEHIEREAMLHNPFALSMLGSCYYFGHGVEADYRKAFTYFSKAVDKAGQYTMSHAMYFCGLCHFNGHGTAHDLSKAASAFRSQVKNYHAPSMEALAKIMMQCGRLSHAVSLYQAAAQQFLPEACYQLAILHLGGKGVEQSVSSAVSYLSYAAEQRHDRACLQLGRMYAKGHGVPQNLERGIRLVTAAADMGNSSAKAELPELEREYLAAGGSAATLQAPATIKAESSASDVADRKSTQLIAPMGFESELSSGSSAGRLTAEYDTASSGGAQSSRRGKKHSRTIADRVNDSSSATDATMSSSSGAVSSSDARGKKPKRSSSAKKRKRKGLDSQTDSSTSARHAPSSSYASSSSPFVSQHGVPMVQTTSGQQMYPHQAGYGVPMVAPGTPTTVSVMSMPYMMTAAPSCMAGPTGHNMPTSPQHLSYTSYQQPQLSTSADVAMLQERAKHNHPDALYLLSHCYHTGKHVAKDEAVAADLMKRAADLGHPKAMVAFGSSLLKRKGKADATSANTAVRYLSKAADMGEASAMYHLANCFLRGDGVPKQESHARDLLSRAAHMGFRQAQDTLQRMQSAQ